MERQPRGCLKNLVIAAVVCVLLAIAAGYLSMGGFRRAIDTRAELDELFGSQESWTPSPDGSIPADRLEAFCAVRRHLADACESLRTAEERTLALQRFDDQEQILRKDFVREALNTVKGGMSIGPVMGGFFDTRNRALLEVGMGLGEYTYIYVIAYHDRLVSQGYEARLFDNPPANRRVRRAMLTMLSRQLEAARDLELSPDLLAALESEVAAMEEDPSRFPWSDGLPEAASASIAPRRQQLDELFCDAAAPLELLRNRRHGPAIETQ